jgi:hypothetical protein
VDFRVRQFAHEGKLFVLSCCSITDEQNIDACGDTEEEKAKIVHNSGGGSAIIGPDGEYLACPAHEGEAILTTEISLEEALPGKQVHDVLGHYTRWDVLSLNFNREMLSPFKTVPSRGTDVDLTNELHELRQEMRELKDKVDRISGGKKNGIDGGAGSEVFSCKR